MIEQIEILNQLKRGDEATIKNVYIDNRDLFLNFAKRYNLSDEDIKDIYQDAFIIFLRNVNSGKLNKLTSSLSTYLIGIAKFKILERFKKIKKEIDSDLALRNLTEEVDETYELDLMDAPELTVEQKLLRKHFVTLGQKCQKLLTLFYYNSLTIKEIQLVGNYNTENVVKSQKSRCLKQLRERINQNE